MSMLSTLDATEPVLENFVAAPTVRTEIFPICDTPLPAAPRVRRNRKPDCRIASSRDEWKAALGLVYRAYVRSGLIPLNRYRMRVTPYHALPTTEALIAADQDEVLCTLSIVGDGRLGLPMEAIYPEEVARRRRQGFRLAEVSCLADAREESEQSFSVVSRLMALTAQYAEHCGLDQLLIAVHPRHAGFYERFLAFEMIGERRTYASVLDHPAVAMALDLNAIEYDHPRVYKRLFGVPFPEEVLEHRPISHELRFDLRMIAAETCADQPRVLACA